MKQLSAINIFIFVIILLNLTSNISHAATPIGNLELTNGSLIAGWAFDPDTSLPTSIHIYVDGIFVHAVTADKYREDIFNAHQRNAAFDWLHPPFGAGTHTVTAHVIGMNAQGVPDGENPALNIKSFNVGCQGLADSDLEWCNNNQPYWLTRQQDTKLLYSQPVTIGINNSYGGLITQLYSNDHSVNLIEEHGGSATQISLYAYDAQRGPDNRWFRKGGCFPTAYLTQSACEAVAGPGNCQIMVYGTGDHVPNCTTVVGCNLNFTNVGWPFNPIQAQGVNCSWHSTSNDVDVKQPIGSTGWHTVLQDPYNYSKSTAFSGLTIDQKVTLQSTYAKIIYTLSYNGPYSQLAISAQEIPAFFTNTNVDKFFYYKPSSSSQVVETTRPESHLEYYLAMPNWRPWPSDGSTHIKVATIDEHWWGVCDQTKTHCVTLATFDPIVERAAFKNLPTNGAYIAPIGEFAVTQGMNKQITLYVFPYKWDQVINGKTIRQHIIELNPGGIVPTITPTPIPPTSTPAPNPLDIHPTSPDGDLDYHDYLTWVQKIKQKLSTLFELNQLIQSL